MRALKIKSIAISSYALLLFETLLTLLMTPIFIEKSGLLKFGEILSIQAMFGLYLFFEGGVATFTSQRIASLVGSGNISSISTRIYSALFLNSISVSLFIIASLLTILIILNTQIINQINIDRSLAIIIMIGICQTIMINTLDNISNALDFPIRSKIALGTSNAIAALAAYKYFDGDLLFPVYILIKNSLAFIFLSLLSYNFLKKNNLLSLNKIEILEDVKELFFLIRKTFGSKIIVTVTSSFEAPFLLIISNGAVVSQYTTTKKLADLIKTVLDRIGGILISPISRLYSSVDKNIFRSLLFRYWLRINIFLIFATIIYIIINKSVVTMWIDLSAYAGGIITMLIGVGLVTTFNSSILSFMLSSVNHYRSAANLLLYENIIKIILGIFLGLKIGIIGYLLAVIIVSTIFCILYIRAWKKILYNVL